MARKHTNAIIYLYVNGVKIGGVTNIRA